jgi:hypothetical protein
MPKSTTVAVAGLLLAALAVGQVPRFRAPARIESGGSPIDLGYYTAPVMFDWNDDGKKDMIVGQFSYGYIAYFENVGEDSAPEFASHEYLQASGQAIQLPYG